MRNDLTIYSEYADEWWQKDGYHFRSLQNLTPFRLALIADFVGDLKDKTVLDLGCGGGLISIPLLEQGARVTGVDISAESVAVARNAAQGKGTFLVSDISSLELPSAYADCVLIVDVLDHIPHFARVLREASRVLKREGRLFVGTLNRTCLSHFFTITLGEGLGFIPRGTHDSKLFIKPEELIDTAGLFDLSHIATQGEWPMFARTVFDGAISLRRAASTAIAYSAVFQKTSDAS